MRILLGPVWLRAVYWSVFGFVIVVASTSLTSSSTQPMVARWPAGTLMLVALAVVFGGLLTVLTTKNGVPYLDAVKDLTPQQRSAAVSVAYGGPVPLDPAIRTGALRLGEVYLKQSALNRRRSLVVLGIFAAGCVVLIATEVGSDSRSLVFHIVLLVVVAGGAAWSQFQLRRIEKQHAVLAKSGPT